MNTSEVVTISLGRYNKLIAAEVLMNMMAQVSIPVYDETGSKTRALMYEYKGMAQRLMIRDEIQPNPTDTPDQT